VSVFDAEHCFVSCHCGKVLPIRWCNISRLLSCLCLSGQEVSRSFDRKKGTHSWPPRSPDLILLDYFFLGEGGC
jgi:hypothetical protein